MLADANRFYTYVLIDPRSNQPFYVGKGQRNRCFQHLMEAADTRKRNAKVNKIRKIQSLGLSVVIQKVLENVSDADAQDFEKLIIAECRDKGIRLTNMTDGGDGSAGYRHAPESLAKMRAAMTGRPKPESQKQKLSAFMKANPIYARPGVLEKVSGPNHWAYGKPSPLIGHKWTDEQRAAQSQRFSGENHPSYGKPCSEQRREAIRAATTGVKKSTTINMRKPRRVVQCPHCGKEGGANTMHRWHFDNCKEKQPC